MIELVESLHDGITATVTVGGGKSEPFSVWNVMSRVHHYNCSHFVYPVLWVGD